MPDLFTPEERARWKALEEEDARLEGERSALHGQMEAVLAPALLRLLQEGEWRIAYGDANQVRPVDGDAERALNRALMAFLGLNWHSCVTLTQGDACLLLYLDDGDLTLDLHVRYDAEAEGVAVPLNVNLEQLREKIREDQRHRLRTEIKRLEMQLEKLGE